MGSYGIGVGRNVAAVVEAHNDDRGIVWPVSVAPWHVVVTVLGKADEPLAVAEDVYGGLSEAGLDVLLDDRAERPGVKFNDAELIGIPVRVTVGARGLERGIVEITPRAGGETLEVAPDEVADTVASLLELPA